MLEPIQLPDPLDVGRCGPPAEGAGAWCAPALAAAGLAVARGGAARAVQDIDEVAVETGASLAAVALAWTSAQPGITATLASATKLEQLDQLIVSMHLDLTDSQIARLTEASEEPVPA